MPPSWCIPASNDRRVRVDCFSKIIARVRSAISLRPHAGAHSILSRLSAITRTYVRSQEPAAVVG